MTTFVVAAALLTALAVGFASWSFVRAPRRATNPGPAREAMNVALYRQRLGEIDAEVAAGRLAPAAREAMAAELGASLVDEAGPDAMPAQDTPPRRREGWPVIVACAVLFPALAVFVYVRIGAFDEWQLSDALTVLREAPTENDLEAVDELVALLEARAAARPGDAETAYLLGHARMRQGDYSTAVAAFESLRPAVTGDLTVLVSLAQARYLNDEGRISPDTRRVMDRALEINPHQPLVLEMLALEAVGTASWAAAVGYLERALAGGLEGEREAALRAGLERARLALTAAGSGWTGERDGATTALTQAAAETPGSGATVGEAAVPAVAVHVSVTLGANAAALPGARVFVIAREVDGPPMPIAVRALSVAELPADVVLTDADAMQPGRRLSQFDRVEVVARLSRSGNAMRQPGDLEAGSGPVNPRESPRLALALGG